MASSSSSFGAVSAGLFPPGSLPAATSGTTSTSLPQSSFHLASPPPLPPPHGPTSPPPLPSAGIGGAPPTSSSSSTLLFSSAPRLRASLLLSAVSEFRLAQQQLFALESSNFPTMEGSEEYGRMWTTFQGKDDQVTGIVEQLDITCHHLEQINRIANTTNQHNNSGSTNTTTPSTAAAASPPPQPHTLNTAAANQGRGGRGEGSRKATGAV